MLEGVMIYRHSESEYTMRPGDTLLIDGEGLHGPHDLVRMPIRFLAVTAYPDSRERRAAARIRFSRSANGTTTARVEASSTSSSSEFGFLQTGVCPEGETRRLQGDHPVSGDVREPQLRQSV
jgi:hypothetical protein